jgi:uncharacterized protein YkwD
MKRALFSLFLALVATVALPLQLRAALTERIPTADSIPVLAKKVLDLTNVERVKEGLQPLGFDASLTLAAEWMAKDMADNGRFSHVDSLGRRIDARAELFGYAGWRMVGENLAVGQATADAAMLCWMRSPGHRENILRAEFTEMGVAYLQAPGSKRGHYWVQTFGTRRSSRR